MKNASVLLFILLSLDCYSQLSFNHTPKSEFNSPYLLVEKFSSKNCMPCRLFSPIFDSIYELNKERIILIEYTSSVPSPGGFYLLNTRDNSSREIFYGIGGVPWVFGNGKSLATADFNSATIDSIQKKSYEILHN